MIHKSSRPRVFLFLPIACLLASSPLNAQPIGEDRYVDFAYHAGDFRIVDRGVAANLYVDSADFPGVIRAVNDLRADIQRVTNRNPLTAHDEKDLGSNAIIVGT